MVCVYGCIQSHIDIGRREGVELALDNLHIGIDLQNGVIERGADLTNTAAGLRRCAVSAIDALRQLPAALNGAVADNVVKAECFSGFYDIL